MVFRSLRFQEPEGDVGKNLIILTQAPTETDAAIRRIDVFVCIGKDGQMSVRD